MRSEVTIVVLGLIVGYCLVSYLMRGTPRRDTAMGQGGPPGFDAGDAGRPSVGRRWFEVLGIAEAASRQEIEQAYRRSISQYHPDKVATLGEDLRHLAERRSTEINAAYDEGMRRLASRSGAR